MATTITASKTLPATRKQRRCIAALYGSYPTDFLSRHEASLLITSKRAADERVDILRDDDTARDERAWGVNAQAFIARKTGHQVIT